MKKILFFALFFIAIVAATTTSQAKMPEQQASLFISDYEEEFNQVFVEVIALQKETRKQLQKAGITSEKLKAWLESSESSEGSEVKVTFLKFKQRLTYLFSLTKNYNDFKAALTTASKAAGLKPDCVLGCWGAYYQCRQQNPGWGQPICDLLITSCLNGCNNNPD